MHLLGSEKEGHMRRDFYQLLWEGDTKTLMPTGFFFSESCISSFFPLSQRVICKILLKP